MKLKICTLTLAALIIGCANTSSLTSKTKTERTPSSAENTRSEYGNYGDYTYGGYKIWPAYITVSYQYNSGKETNEIQANIQLEQIKQIFLNHTSDIENIHDVVISKPRHYPGNTYVEYHVQFKAEFNESVDREADNNFRCEIGFDHNKATNFIIVRIHRCSSSNGYIAFGENRSIRTPLEGPIPMKVIQHPKIFKIN